MINFSHWLKFTLTIAKDGKASPVGVMKLINPIPNKKVFTISCGSTPTTEANEPMMGMVTTAIPEDDEMNKVSRANTNINTGRKSIGGMPSTKWVA